MAVDEIQRPQKNILVELSVLMFVTSSLFRLPSNIVLFQYSKLNVDDAAFALEILV